jgi:hypothetical protein
VRRFCRQYSEQVWERNRRIVLLSTVGRRLWASSSGKKVTKEIGKERWAESVWLRPGASGGQACARAMFSLLTSFRRSQRTVKLASELF